MKWESSNQGPPESDEAKFFSQVNVRLPDEKIVFSPKTDANGVRCDKTEYSYTDE